MNVYTLHKAGSFQPPKEGCDPPEMINAKTVLRKGTKSNLHVLVEGNEAHCSDTSQTSGTNSNSEKTTPRQNVTNNNFTITTPQQPQKAEKKARISASRIDATGVITEVEKETPKVKSSRSLKVESTSKLKKVNSPTGMLNKVVQNQRLIQIQARDEFMNFQDTSDLISHLTTPSAIRASPLEDEYLVYDHEEFAEATSLFSAITIPKALRKKKNKKKAKVKNAVQELSSDKEEIKITTQSSNEESDGEEKPKSYNSTVSPIKERSEKLDQGPSPRKSKLRGGRRTSKSSKNSNSDESNSASQDDQEKSSLSQDERIVEEDMEDIDKNDQQKEGTVPEQKPLPAPPSVTLPEGPSISNHSVLKTDITDIKPNKSRHLGGKTQQSENEDVGLKPTKEIETQQKQVINLDATAATCVDSTARNEGSHTESSEEFEYKVANTKKIPNSKKRGKASQLGGCLQSVFLPASLFCIQRKKERQEQQAQQEYQELLSRSFRGIQRPSSF